MTKINRRFIERLKKMRRVEIKHIVRLDDETVAYYDEETQEIIMFIDVILQEALDHFRIWGSQIDTNLSDFIVKFVGTRTTLHELIHYCGIRESIQCEYIALKHTWGHDKLAFTVASKMYPKEKIFKVTEIELD